MAADVRATCGTTTATSGPDDSTINFDGRHDNGDGRYTTATGGTTTRHDSGKGQQGDRMHDHFDGRHDDDKGQQGSSHAEAVFCRFPSPVGQEAREEDHLGCIVAGVREVRFAWAWRLAAAIAKLNASAGWGCPSSLGIG